MAPGPNEAEDRNCGEWDRAPLTLAAKKKGEESHRSQTHDTCTFKTTLQYTRASTHMEAHHHHHSRLRRWQQEAEVGGLASSHTRVNKHTHTHACTHAHMRTWAPCAKGRSAPGWRSTPQRHGGAAPPSWRRSSSPGRTGRPAPPGRRGPRTGLALSVNSGSPEPLARKVPGRFGWGQWLTGWGLWLYSSPVPRGSTGCSLALRRKQG